MAEELGRGLADAAFLGRDPGRGAAPPGRCAGGGRGRDRRPDRRPGAARHGRGGRCRPEAGGHRRVRARRPRWCSMPAATGTRSARSRSRGQPPGRRPDPADRAAGARRRPVTALDGQTRPLDADDVATWHSLGLAVTSADLVGVMRGALTLADRLRPASAGSTAPPSDRSRRSSTCWPTPSSPWRARAASRCTPRGRSTRCRPAEALAAASAAKAYCARAARSVCETADPGARRHRQHLGVPRPRLPAPGPALGRRARRRRAPTSTGCWPPAASEATMDFADSPEELEFRLRLRDWLSDEQPRPPAVLDGRRVLGRPGGLAPDALRRRVLRPVLADRGRRPRPAQRVRGDPRRGADRGRHAAAAERRATSSRGSCATGARTSSAASCPDS